MKKFFSLICFCCFGWLLSSCGNVQEYSDVPEIRFKKLAMEYLLDDMDEITKTAVLTFSFVDGDGDIGVLPKYMRDPDDEYSRIHYLWLYKKIPDATNPDFFILDTFRFNDNSTENSAEIPWDQVMNKTGAHNKVLKGTIEIKLFAPTDGLHEIDTMLIDFHIFDRAKNKSNVERTPKFCIHNSLGDIDK